MLRYLRAARVAAVVTLGAALWAGIVATSSAQWRPATGGLMTRWAAEVTPERVHAEYPRPQMARAQWQNLNGLWEYAIRPAFETRPVDWDGQILVPFVPQSALSGLKKSVSEHEYLWYRRTFEIPAEWRGKQIQLNFEAVDWETEVFVNGRSVGTHRGGYDPFSFDITHALRSEGPQELVVRVWDPSDKGYQPRGKQVQNPHAIWYTSVTGIWQTVWLEPVARQHIRQLRMVPNPDEGALELNVQTAETTNAARVRVAVTGLHQADERVEDPQFEVTPGESRSGDLAFVVRLADARLWSPDEPWLYDLQLQLLDEQGNVVDQLDSYFGLRKIAVQKDATGVNRLFLNGAPLFHFGPLDQGWWPDGLYTAPTDDALRYDIEITKRLGFNMCRKHVKVEPRRWYYHCDRLGLLVWQDMPSGDRYIGREDADIERVAQSEMAFRREYSQMIATRYNHPSIVVWVPFNEGWGQFKTDEILAWTKQLDPTRLVDGPSGWTDRGSGDMNDIHVYPGPGIPPLEDRRAAVLGEFGGLGWPVTGHLWQEKDNWGYRTYKSREELMTAYEDLMRKLEPLIGQGLAAAVYTQTTDVEIEVNGLMTYDREVIKLPESVREVHQRLLEGPADTGAALPGRPTRR